MTGSQTPTQTVSSSVAVNLGGHWQTQVYNEKGEHLGFFDNETDAAKWVGDRGYEITRVRPVKGKKP